MPGVKFFPTPISLQKLKEASAHKMSASGPDGPKYFTDEFFAEGNEVCGIYAKTCIIDEDNEDLCHEVLKTFKCDIPNCDLVFDNLLKYELHYNSCHRFSCSQCRKHLPSPHLLDLHLEEAHDSFFQVQSERKPMFRCFVESCKLVSKNGAERKKHCIETHKFPHDFHFEPKKRKPVVPKKKKQRPTHGDAIEVDPPSDGVEPTNSKPQKTQKARKPKEAQDSPVTKPVFTFGRKTGGKSFNKNSKKPDTNIDMGDLMDTLPQI